MKTQKIIGMLVLFLIFVGCAPTVENGAKIVKNENGKDFLKLPNSPTGLVISSLNIGEGELWVTYKDTINKNSDPIKIRYKKAGVPFQKGIKFYEIQLPWNQARIIRAFFIIENLFSKNILILIYIITAKLMQKIYTQCQSCGMPLRMDKWNSGSSMYCSSCYKDGKFTRPNISVKEMQKLVDNVLKKEMKRLRIFRRLAVMQIPKLERWKR